MFRGMPAELAYSSRCSERPACDIPFWMMPWNVSHMYKGNLDFIICFSCFAVVDQREVSGSKHL